MSGTNPFRRRIAQQSSNVPTPTPTPIGSVQNAFGSDDRPEPRIPPIDTGRFNGPNGTIRLQRLHLITELLMHIRPSTSSQDKDSQDWQDCPNHLPTFCHIRWRGCHSTYILLSSAQPSLSSTFRFALSPKHTRRFARRPFRRGIRRSRQQHGR